MGYKLTRDLAKQIEERYGSTAVRAINTELSKATTNPNSIYVDVTIDNHGTWDDLNILTKATMRFSTISELEEVQNLKYNTWYDGTDAILFNDEDIEQHHIVIVDDNGETFMRKCIVYDSSDHSFDTSEDGWYYFSDLDRFMVLSN